MFLLEVDPDDFKAASRVAAYLELKNISLLKVSCDNPFNKLRRFRSESVEDRSLQDEICVGISKYFVSGRRGLLRTQTRIRVNFLDERKSAKKKLGFIEVELLLDYSMPAGQVPKKARQELLPGFARVNSIYNGWPYLRQEVSRIATGMGFSFVLPLLSIRPEKSDSPKSQTANGS